MNSTLHKRMPTLTWWLIILELAIVVLAALLATSYFLRFDPYQRIIGAEYEYLTSSSFTIAQAWREHGYIPLWQPYFWTGEPLIEWGFSTVLNPFSTIPSLMFGAQYGLQISLVIHVIIGGIGGWILARVLGLGTLGRVVLGVLMSTVALASVSPTLNAQFNLLLNLTVTLFMVVYALCTLSLALDRRQPVRLRALGWLALLFCALVVGASDWNQTAPALGLVLLLTPLGFWLNARRRQPS